MKKLILKSGVLIAVIAAAVWLYLTEYQKYRVRHILDQAHEELVSGRMDMSRIGSLASSLSRIFDSGKTMPSVKEYAENYLKDYRLSGDPTKFAACVMIEHPNLKWANGVGRSFTIPLSIMLVEDAKNYPPASRAYMEEIACTLLPKATGQSFGVNGLVFVDDEASRSAAIQQWHEWYQTNKFAVLERDQRTEMAVEARINQQKDFADGITNLSK